MLYPLSYGDVAHIVAVPCPNGMPPGRTSGVALNKTQAYYEEARPAGRSRRRRARIPGRDLAWVFAVGGGAEVSRAWAVRSGSPSWPITSFWADIIFFTSGFATFRRASR